MCQFTIDAADDGDLDVAAMMMHAMRAVKDAAEAEGRRTTDKAKYRIVRVTDASEGARGRRMSTLTDMMRSWQMDCCREGEGRSAFRFRSGALLHYNVRLAIVAYYLPINEVGIFAILCHSCG